MNQKLQIFYKKVIYGFSILFLLFLSITSLFYSSDGYVVAANAKLVWVTVLGGFIFWFLLGMLAYFVEKVPNVYSMVIGIILLLLPICFCSWWIINSANLPSSDAKSIYDIAVRAKNHDLLPMAPTGSYMSLWPFQAGFVMFEETILRLLPAADEMTIQWANVFFVFLSLISLYMLVRRLFLTKRTRYMWCILMVFCFPFYFYVNNMYSDIPSFALSMFGVWMISEFLDKPFWIKILLAGMGIAGGVAIKKNSLIFVLACMLVLMTQLFTKNWKRHLIVCIAIVLATLAGNSFPRYFYEYRAQNSLGQGVPVSAYIAMGLQWSEERSPGGWNGYHSDLFLENDYNSELTAQISKENIADSLHYMIDHPAYGIQFFYYKSVEQWNREDFACLYSTLDFYAERSQAAWNIYQGPVKDKWMTFMSIYQSIVYVGAFVFCTRGFWVWRKNKSLDEQEMKDTSADLWQLVLLVAFIGGFLFSLIWEAGARYVMPYFIVLIPYAAEGWGQVSLYIEKKRVRKSGV